MNQFDMFSQQTNNYESLDDVIEALKHMKDDPLADAGTNVVISRGNPQAKLLIIGEAPGPEENIRGKPFVGRAGQLLTKIIEACGWTRSDVYIMNVLKCRPPENLFCRLRW